MKMHHKRLCFQHISFLNIQTVNSLTEACLGREKRLFDLLFREKLHHCIIFCCTEPHIAVKFHLVKEVFKKNSSNLWNVKMSALFSKFCLQVIWTTNTVQIIFTQRQITLDKKILESIFVYKPFKCSISNLKEMQKLHELEQNFT